MDQRNAGGQSRAPITAQDGWDTYTADHVALLDHLRIDRCHLYGQCIGGSFILNLIKTQPERVQRAVLAQPIGRVGAMAPGRPARFKAWAESLKDHPEATQPVLDAFYRNLYAPGFVYCVDRDFVKTVRTPCLVLAGNDEAHPYADLRGALEAASELRVHRGVEDGRGADLGQSPRRGVPGKAHIGPRVSWASRPRARSRIHGSILSGSCGVRARCFCCYLQEINSGGALLRRRNPRLAAAQQAKKQRDIQPMPRSACAV